MPQFELFFFTLAKTKLWRLTFDPISLCWIYSRTIHWWAAHLYYRCPTQFVSSKIIWRWIPLAARCLVQKSGYLSTSEFKRNRKGPKKWKSLWGPCRWGYFLALELLGKQGTIQVWEMNPIITVVWKFNLWKNKNWQQSHRLVPLPCPPCCLHLSGWTWFFPCPLSMPTILSLGLCVFSWSSECRSQGRRGLCSVYQGGPQSSHFPYALKDALCLTDASVLTFKIW